MKNIYLFTIFLVLLLNSCEKEEKQTADPSPITLNSEYDSYSFYNLIGEVKHLDSFAYMESGFQISTSPSFDDDYTIFLPVIKEQHNTDLSDKFITARIPTEYGKTYYFRAYYLANKKRVITGDTKSFTANWHVPELKVVGYIYEKDKLLSLTGTIEGLAAMKNDTLLKQDDYTYGIELSLDENFNDFYFASVDKSDLSQIAQNDTFHIDVPLFISGKSIYYRTSFRTQAKTFNMGDSFHSDAKDFTINWQPSYVDLGLSVKWATCNIGGYTPSDHGDYYCWGLTETYYHINQESINALADWYYNKQISGWKTEYPHGYDEFHYNKNYTDYKDVACTLWGTEWRIPSDQEFIELTSNCTWTLDTMYNVAGYRITSNISGFEENSIFLPMAEAFISTGIQDPNIGHYWTSSLGLKDHMMPNSFYFGLGYTHDSFSSFPYFGLTIRPVTQ